MQAYTCNYNNWGILGTGKEQNIQGLLMGCSLDPPFPPLFNSLPQSPEFRWSPTDSLGETPEKLHFHRLPWQFFPMLEFENTASTISNLSSNSSGSCFLLHGKITILMIATRAALLTKGGTETQLSMVGNYCMVIPAIFASPRGQLSSKWLTITLTNWKENNKTNSQLNLYLVGTRIGSLYGVSWRVKKGSSLQINPSAPPICQGEGVSSVIWSLLNSKYIT